MMCKDVPENVIITLLLIMQKRLLKVQYDTCATISEINIVNKNRYKIFK